VVRKRENRMAEQVTKLIIDRTIWLRGESPNRSRLLRSDDGKRCCLGIYLGACGVPDEALMDVESPQGVLIRAAAVFPEQALWLLEPKRDVNSDQAHRLMLQNDYFAEAGDNPETREQAIASVFADQGIEVTFTN